MTGKAIIANEGGWSCTNTAKVNFEDTPLRDMTGKLSGVKRRWLIDATDVYDVNSGFDRAKQVEVSVMAEKAMKHFTGAIRQEKNGSMIINVTPSGDGEKVKEMISKIKQIGGH